MAAHQNPPSFEHAAKEFEKLQVEFKEFSADMKNPLVVGALLSRLAFERQQTNAILAELNKKLELLGAHLENLEAKIQLQQVLESEKQNEPNTATASAPLTASPSSVTSHSLIQPTPVAYPSGVATGPTRAAPNQAPVLLAESDEPIVAFVQKHGKACAQDVQHALGYSGTNGASARLNRLAQNGVLTKQQVGRKVYYLPVTQ